MNTEREEMLRRPGYWIAGFKSAFTSFLLEYIRDNKLSQDDLSDKIGCHKSYLSRMLNAGNNHRIDSIVRAVHATGHVLEFNVRKIDDIIDEENKQESVILSHISMVHGIDFMLDNIEHLRQLNTLKDLDKHSITIEWARPQAAHTPVQEDLSKQQENLQLAF